MINYCADLAVTYVPYKKEYLPNVNNLIKKYSHRNLIDLSFKCLKNASSSRFLVNFFKIRIKQCGVVQDTECINVNLAKSGLKNFVKVCLA
jgi:hypothetical protein